MIRVYKEGQGIWARGVMAGTIGVTGLFAAVSTYQYCQENSYLGGNPIPYVALDGKSLQASDRILVTACGRCENSGMLFSEDRRTVGRRWGKAPVRIEPVDATMALSAGDWQAWALAPDGRRKEAARVVTVGKACDLVLSTAHGTLWYLLLR